MAGPANISVNQSPQYGDKSALQRFKANTTQMPMTGNPTNQKPTGVHDTARRAAPQAAPQEEVPFPDEHARLADQLAAAQRAAIRLAQDAQQPDAGPHIRFYAELAQQYAQAMAYRFRESTPFFR